MVKMVNVKNLLEQAMIQEHMGAFFLQSYYKEIKDLVKVVFEIAEYSFITSV